MKKYLSSKLSRLTQHLKDVAWCLESADNTSALDECAATLETMAMAIRTYQLEWQKTVTANAPYEVDANELAEMSQNGLIRLY